jgi:hypothetical protein
LHQTRADRFQAIIFFMQSSFVPFVLFVPFCGWIFAFVRLCGYTPVEFARPQVTSTMSLLPVRS